jgi:hypothetical protein
LATFLSKALLLSLLPGMLAPILAPSTFNSSANATNASLILNLDKFVQWTTWVPDGGLGTDNTYSGSNHTPYINQSTTQVTANTNLIVMTNQGANQAGYLWNTNQYSYANDFTVTATWYLGQKDNGGEGMAFVMRPLSSWPNGGSATGSGRTFSEATPSTISVVVDTYQNTGEIANDHLSIYSTNSNGDVTKYGGSGVALKDSN